MNNQSLVEKAKAVKIAKVRRAKISPEQVELVKAWFNDDVTITQMARAVGKSQTYIYSLIAIVARDLWIKNDFVRTYSRD